MINKFILLAEDGDQFELLTVPAEQGRVVINNRSAYNFIKRNQKENNWVMVGKNGKYIGNVFDSDDLNNHLMKE